ncbi:MAG: hypothetical protein ACQET8_21950 [Bacillota bacterium]|jgi:hypothetical protein
MRNIGLRIGTKEIYFIVLEGSKEQCTYIASGKINEPAAYDLPKTLSYYKQHIESLFKEYKIDKCGIKTAEPLATRRGVNEGAKKRLYIEGVIMESVHSLGKPLICGPFATFASLVKIKKQSDYLETDDFYNIPEWKKKNKNLKEATLAGVGVMD